jgi:1-acyl-sn-glycerol-3-phosphate acyltransferase
MIHGSTKITNINWTIKKAMSLRTLLFLPVFLVLTVFFSLFSMAAALLDSTGNRAHRVASWWASCVLWFSRVRVRVTYLEPLDSGQSYLFAANHQSAFDIFALLGALNHQFRWLAKESLFRVPFMGWAMTRVGYIPINRENPKSAYKSLLLAAEKIKGGTSVLIFPEGTRQPPNHLGEFKKGGFILAAKAGRPLVPISISGSGQVMPQKSYRLHPGTIDLVVGKPISTTGVSPKAVEPLMDEVREAIRKHFKPVEVTRP